MTGAFVKIGFFRSESDLAYHDLIQGDLFTQTARTIDLVRTKYLKAAITYQGIQRIERYPVPDAALREAILNALVHRDYAIGAPVQIRIHEDRLRIWNPAVLPEGWTVKNLMAAHASTPFNSAIANVFFRSGEIETWGRGIERVFAACKAAGITKPVLDFDGTGFTIEFRYAPEYLKAIAASGAVPGGEVTDLETTQKTTQKILTLLREKPTLSRREIAEFLGDITEDGVKYQLNKLKLEGLIRRVGPDHGGHWEVIDKS